MPTRSVVDELPSAAPDAPAAIVVDDDDPFVLELVRHVIAELPAVDVLTFPDGPAHSSGAGRTRPTSSSPTPRCRD